MDMLSSDNTAHNGGGQAHAGGFDWPFVYNGLTFDALTNTPAATALGGLTPMSAQPMTDGRDRNGSSGDEAASQSPASARARCTQLLTSLLQDLQLLYDSIPSAPLHNANDETLEEYTADYVRKHPRDSFLEAIFSCTHGLVEVYPTATELALSFSQAESSSGETIQEECGIENCVHHLPLPPELAEVENLIRSRPGLPRLDVTLANLLLSCHHRLLDSLDRILAVVLSCVKVSLASPEFQGTEFSLPELRVGSFTAPKSSAIAMQAVLLKHLASTMGERLDRLVMAVAGRAEESSAGDGGEGGNEARVLAMQCELLRESHAAKMRQLGAVGEAIVHFRLMK